MWSSFKSNVRTHPVNGLLYLLSTSSDEGSSLTIFKFVVRVLSQLVEGRLHIRYLAVRLIIVFVRRHVTHGGDRRNDASSTVNQSLEGARVTLASSPVVVSEFSRLGVCFSITHQLLLYSDGVVMYGVGFGILSYTVVALSSVGGSHLWGQLLHC